MAKLALTPEVLELIAQRFRALAEPARLHILQTLRAGELSVGDLVHETELSQANVSKHLQQLYSLGFVRRRKEGLYVYYAIADQSVFRLCDVMCGQLETRMKAQRRMLAG